MAAKVVQDFDEPVSSPMALEGKPPGMAEEENLAPFIEPLSKEFECPLCLQTLTEPTLVSCCGCHFCQDCIARVLKDGKPCPLCNHAGFQVMRDKGMERKIRSLKVGCTMQYRGCQWEGELRSLEEHLARDCGYIEVDCEFKAVGCGTKLLRKDIASHAEARSHNHLLLVSTLCLKQREEFEQRVEQLQGQLHQREEQFEQRMEQLQVQSHQREEEQKERHKEELQQLRMESELRVQQLQTQLYQKCEEIAEIQQKKHIQQKKESEQRLQQLQEQLHQKAEQEKCKQKEEMLKQKRELERRLQQLEGQLAQKDGQISRIHQESKKQVKEIQQSLEVRLKEEMALLRKELRESITVESDQKLRKLQEQFQQKHRELDIKVQHNKERVETAVLFGQQDRRAAVSVQQGPLELMGKGEKVTDYAPSLLDSAGMPVYGESGREGIFITMPAVRRHKANDSAWYSPPFYYLNGHYKFCIVVYAKGRRSGYGKYVSLYYCIMKNRTDHLQLQWPLQTTLCTTPVVEFPQDPGSYYRGSVQLGDYESGEVFSLDDCCCDRAGHIQFLFKQKWNRPKSDREGGVGWGYDQFLSHSALRDILKKTQSDTLELNIRVCTHVKDQYHY